MFKLEPCDILLYVNEGTDIFSKISRWGAGIYEHVSMYLDKMRDCPLIFESNLRGASIVSLGADRGRLVKIMRPQISEVEKQLVINRAFELASTEIAYYDYPIIILSCVPRILKMKFPFLPIPVNYCRDWKVICSEGVAECFWRAFIPILPKDIVPLPIDFETSSILEPVYEGRILEDIQ